MPNTNGYDLARLLRNEPGLQQVVLVALTGYGQESDREKSKEAGFDHHLVKPVSLEALRNLLTNLPANSDDRMAANSDNNRPVNHPQQA